MTTSRTIIKAARALEPLEQQKGMIVSFLIEMPGTQFAMYGSKAVVSGNSDNELLLPDNYRRRILAIVKECLEEHIADLEKDIDKILEQFEDKPVLNAINDDIPIEYKQALLSGYRYAKDRVGRNRNYRDWYNIHGHKIYVKLSQEKGVPSVVYMYDDNKIKWELLIGNGEEQE